jgi:uncharacterized protein (TIRG00374 family)
VRAKTWLGVLVSLALLVAASRGVDLGELTEAVGRVQPLWLVPVVGSLAVRFWLTAVRWQLLLRPVKPIGVHRLFGVTLIGFMANNVLPARMGEFVRAYALGRTEALPPSLAFATVVLERVFDGVTLVLFLVGGLLFLSPEPWLVVSAALSLALYLAVLLALCAVRHPRGERAAEAVLDRLPARARDAGRRMLGSFRGGLDVLGDRGALAAIAGLSLAVWAVSALGTQAMFVAMGLDLPLHAAFVLQAIVAVLLVFPSTPGFVGPFQAGVVLGLALYAVPRATALSLSIVFHAVNYVPVTVAGLAYLAALGLSLRELRAAGQEAA